MMDKFLNCVFALVPDVQGSLVCRGIAAFCKLTPCPPISLQVACQLSFPHLETCQELVLMFCEGFINLKGNYDIHYIFCN